MTAPVWRSAGTVATSSSDANITPGLPSGYQSGDILLITYNGLTAADHTTPAGYTEVTSSPRTDSFGGYEGVCWKRATSSESAPTIKAYQARIHAISGCISTGSPIDATAVTDQSSGGTTSVSATGITTTAADDMVFVYVCAGNVSTTVSAETNSNLASFAERTDDGTAQGLGMAIATGGKTTAGATGTTTATLSTTGTPVTWVIGLLAGSGTSTVNGADGSSNIVDTAIVQANVPGADTGAGVDTATVTAPVGAGDTGAGVDTGKVLVSGAADSGAADEATTILAGGATLKFASDSGSSVEGVAPLVIKDSDAFVAAEALQTATLGIQGVLPPGPRIVRIGASSTTSSG